jgi:dihydrofolate reductase
VRLHLIFARASNGVIGKAGVMPWHLPEDLAHFKRSTADCPVIMGRKTWESLPVRFRPLPGRLNVVITRQSDWQAAGAVVAHSLPEATALCDSAHDVWVIGGAEIYQQALPLASSAVVTEIEAHFEGDTFAPQLGPGWIEQTRERHTSATGLNFSFVRYLKTQGV